ncbi:MAG: tripartite tricarboxylate transporter substrate binding protein [Halomonas sp.]|uniref:Bug family tripartite tricarboxylate transporter substrate binding protein n=1 Tax=Halomonas sp. TaxID=1486246 RepID=UPI0028701DEC|nr:tripartite tricarboxylate transporter substrate binding protein [Halomonas sp.]MDR9438639.1 tripartite tricarboxylate transporter substrate binding protein [Halomonas sp.]
MKFTYKKLALAMTAVAAVGLAGAAHAEYPEEDITYIIPFDPGGESDVTARFQEPVLEEELGVSVNVTHRPGGGGAVAWSEFQNSAEPDGYEIIGVNIPHIIGQPIQRSNAGYETDDWRIVTFFHSTPNALIVHNDSPYDTLEDLIEDARENPEAITLGGSGTYSANHLDMLRFEKEADIDLTYIPFSGTGPLKGALEGGHVGGIFNYTMLGTEMADSVKVLAVASEERVKALPEAPTFKEQGYDIVGGAYRGVAVPEGTPDEVVETLEAAFAEANRQIAEKQEPLGFVMESITGDEIDEVIGMLRDAYGPILEDAE